MSSHIEPAHEGGKLNPGPHPAGLRDLSNRRSDETDIQWRRRLRRETADHVSRQIEADRLRELRGRTDRLRAERITAGIPLRRARDTGKRPPPQNSIERKAIHLDSIKHEIREFTGLHPTASHVPGGIPAHLDEMESAGHEAIARALRGFKPELGNKLSTYVKVSVRNAVRGAAAPGVRDAMADRERLTSMSQRIGHDEDGGFVEFGDNLTDEDIDPELYLPDIAWERVKLSLPEREFTVLSSRHLGASRREVGKQIGLSVERVRQIEVVAIAHAAEVLRPEIERGSVTPVYGGGKGFQAEQWHLEGLQLRILKSAKCKSTPRDLPHALERLADNCHGPSTPLETDHLYPTSLGKVYPPQNKIAVTIENVATLRAAEQRYPLKINPRAYTEIGDDLPKLARTISWAEFYRICGRPEIEKKHLTAQYLCIAVPYEPRASIPLRRIAA